ncbi:MAG: response regulator transcription factor [Deferrisomatales bacterium]
MTEPTPAVVRLFLVEDHPVFRSGLRELLEQEPGFTVCGEAEDVGQAWEEIRRTAPDLAVVDITLKGRSGLELVRLLAGWERDCPVLVLSMHEEAVYAERSLRAGARGYIMKHETFDSIVGAIRHVLAGRVYVRDRVMASILSRGATRHPTPPGDDGPRLSDRELEVLELIGRGVPTREIADRLSLSGKTVGTYRDRLKEKLGLKSAAELVCYAARWLEKGGGAGDPDAPS